MTELRAPEISDKDWINSYLKKENTRSCDYTFGNLYMWDSRYRKHITSTEDRLIISLLYTKLPFFAFPVGSGALSPAIERMKKIAENGPLFIRAVTDEQKALLEAEYPGRFFFTPDRASFDYVYLAEKLASYSGRKLHSKRSYCSKFEKNTDWDFVPLTKELVPACMDMFDAWMNESAQPTSDIEEEKDAILRGFRHWEELGLEGGVLRSEGRVIGFTIGELITDDTFDVHFEKAYATVDGAYPMVTREFARQILREHPGVVYLNREEDMGLHNLRKAKKSLYPEFLLKKYIAREI